MRFTYRSGERPLAGFTLKRGVGQGGFGEVYFAVSDSGKEVALKLLRGSSDIELRGVANCLNLKHQNLVHIYDLKVDAQGDKWLVMEYVLGDSLAHVIDRHPDGMPVSLCVNFFLNLSRAVGYLHDHGVVHRDLKPANIFLEHGNLKVGDYGLCKAISATNRKLTKQIGTIYYMAPEIGSGSYTKSIDIYACGIILHEMLTGHVPFEGETDNEILMKHLTSTPDVSKVPQAFRAVILKAMQKNPDDRYTSMAEFTQAVQSAHPSELLLSMPVVAKVSGSHASSVVLTPTAAATTMPATLSMPTVEPIFAKAVPLATALPVAPAVRSAWRGSTADLASALTKAPIGAGLGTFAWLILTQNYEYAAIGKMFLIALACAWGLLLLNNRAGYHEKDTWGRRLRMGLFGASIGLLMFWLDGWTTPAIGQRADESTVAESYLFEWIQMPPKSVTIATKYLLYFACLFAAGRWWRGAAKDRPDQIAFLPIFMAFFWGGILLFLWPHEAGNAFTALTPLAVAMFTIQWASAWVEPIRTNPSKKRRLQNA